MARFFSNLFATKTKNARKASKNRLNVEALEDRQMLAADAIFNAALAQIEITGNAANDKVVINYIDSNNVRIAMNELDAAGNFVGGTYRERTFALSGVSKIQFRGEAGNDQFYNSTSIATYAYGGLGNDKLSSGAGFDYLQGDSGSDTYLYLPGPRGTDMIVEAANADYDYLDFAVFGESVTVDLANASLSTPQNVSPNLRLFLTDATGIENVYGSQLGDTLRGNQRGNIFFGNGGADTLEGREGNDYMDGGAGSDRYFFAGLGLGSDRIIEADNLDQDALDFTGFGAAIQVNLGFAELQTVSAGNLQLTLAGGMAGIEDLYGSMLGDSVLGNSRSNTLEGMGGGDYLKGLGGGDILRGGTGDDSIEGGAGDDNLYGGTHNDTYVFSGTSLGLDFVSEADNADSDTLDFTYAGFGATVNVGYRYSQTVSSGNLALVLGSETAVENVKGSSQRDVITGNTRNNRLEGAGGSDHLDGISGNDSLAGGIGSDTFFFGEIAYGWTTIEEADAQDSDTIDFSAFAVTVTVDLAVTGYQPVTAFGLVSLNLTSSTGIENVVGGSGSDTLRGNLRNNSLEGGIGDDILEGRGGDDLLVGGWNSDTYLFGDVYHPASGGSLGADRVTEDAMWHEDKLDFSGFNAGITLYLGSDQWQTVRAGLLQLKFSTPSAIEQVEGSRYADYVQGNIRNNLLSGGDGRDHLNGMERDDILRGGRGKDILEGAWFYSGTSMDDMGRDSLYGDGGDDQILGGLMDHLEGGAGIDRITRGFSPVVLN